VVLATLALGVFAWLLSLDSSWALGNLLSSIVLTTLGLTSLLFLRYAYTIVEVETGELVFHGFFWQESISFIRKDRPARVAMIQKDARYLIPMRSHSRFNFLYRWFIALTTRRGISPKGVWSDFVVFYIRNPITRKTRRLILPAITQANRDTYLKLAESIRAAGIPLSLQNRLWNSFTVESEVTESPHEQKVSS
jgi:hypothetical protein